MLQLKNCACAKPARIRALSDVPQLSGATAVSFFFEVFLDLAWIDLIEVFAVYWPFHFLKGLLVLGNGLVWQVIFTWMLVVFAHIHLVKLSIHLTVMPEMPGGSQRELQSLSPVDYLVGQAARVSLPGRVNPLWRRTLMVNLKMLTAAAAFASLGIAAPIAMAEDTTSATTIHEVSPRAGTDVGTTPDAMPNKQGEMEGANGAEQMDVPTEAGKKMNAPDAPVHTSPYKKTYPDEKDMGEVDE